MEVEEEPKKQIKAGRWGCLIAIIIIALLVIAFFSGIFDFQEIEN